MVKMTKRTMEKLFREAKEAPPGEDPVSEWYQEQVSMVDRRRTGQVYTPPMIAFLMARLSVAGIEGEGCIARALDPACGSGTFLRAIVQVRKKALTDGLELVGYETMVLPATLSALNISAVAAEGLQVKIIVGDFFDHAPEGDMDLVIGNPPYIRQELLPTKASIRRKMKGQHGRCAVSSRSDLYAYFIEHATGALRSEGLLTFIVPDKWMDVGYGESLKRFLMENYRMRTILSFDVNVFEKAMVDSVVMVFERCKDPKARASTMVNMVRLKRAMTVDGIVRAVSESGKGAARGYEKVEVRQGSLDPRARWSMFLRAPKAFKEILGSNRTVLLSEVKGASIRRGVTTNLTRFFFPSEKDVARLRIPKRFLARAVKSPKDFEGLVLDKAPGMLLLIPGRSSKRDKAALVPVLKWANRWIWGGSKSRARDLPSFKGKGDGWFVLVTRPPADIIVPKFVREGRPRFVHNKARAHASDTFQTISLGRSKVLDRDTLLGCLNSVVGALSCELVCRVEGRGLLQLMTYELGNVVVPDLGKLNVQAKRAIVSGYRELVEGSGPGALDRAVLDGLKVTKKKQKGIARAYDKVLGERLERARAQVPVR